MSCPCRPSRLVLTTSLVVAVLSVGTPARAQTGAFGQWSRPVVTQVTFSLERSGQGSRELDLGRPVPLSAGERVTIVVTAYDQNGRRFPRDRFRMDADPDSDCGDRVELSDWSSSGELEARAGNGRGACTVVLWVPGNLNLEYELIFEVGGLGLTNYTETQANQIVERLYRAILQRDVDDESRRMAAAEVQRGRIENQVRSMIASGEFHEIRQRQNPVEVLTSFYRGLLGREPDAPGLGQYLEELSRGRHAQAIMNLVQSEEFEKQLVGR